MRKGTVKSGLNLLLAALMPLILATFYHEQIAGLLILSLYHETMLVYLGFFWGGILGCLGILVTVAGLALSAGKSPEVRLAPTVILLLAALISYFILFYSSVTTTEPVKLRPGETITI
jgi:membrane-bound ClpP family serine protease